MRNLNTNEAHLVSGGTVMIIGGVPVSNAGMTAWCTPVIEALVNAVIDDVITTNQAARITVFNNCSASLDAFVVNYDIALGL